MNRPYREELLIEASPDDVFDHFLKPELMVQWMGDFARLEAWPGGLFHVDINGVLIRGQYVRIERPHLVEFTWGEAGNAAMPPGATRVVVTFANEGNATRVTLVHEGLTPDEAEKHAIGWPHFLGRLVILASGGDPGPDPWAVK